MSLFQEKPELKSLIDDGFVHESDMLFQAVFERNKGRFSVHFQFILFAIRLTMKNLIGREHSINSQ